jgi:hypothetical protein
MYIVEYLQKATPYAERVKLIVADANDLFSIVYLLDNSDQCNAWRILEGWKPEDFGWGKEGWDKHRANGFHTEDYYGFVK